MFRLIPTILRFVLNARVPRTAVSRLLMALLVVGYVMALEPLRLPLGSASAAAEEPAIEQGPGEDAGIELTLAARQQQVAERFKRLEELLLRLAELEATENPERSALLRRAAKQSRDSFILDRMSAASEALSGSQYQQAIDAQQSANENLAALLKLLLTEDRSERIRNEKERIANWIKDLKREERKQRAARARTENGAEFDALTEEQREILEKASELRKQMSEDEEDDPTAGSQESSEDPSGEEGAQSESGEPQKSQEGDSDGQPSEESESSAIEQAEQALKEAEERLAEAKEKAEAAENNEEASEAERAQAAEELEQAQQDRDAKEKALAEAKQQQPASDSEQSDSESGDSESGDSESGDSESGDSESGESESGESQQSESEQDSSESQQPQSPQQEAEKKLQSAIERMKEAQQELEDAKREEAIERQREAEKNLREAIDRLEKILRQLREEEMQRELARLEGRLRKMAQMQTKVLDQTRELAELPVDARDRQTDLRAGNLAGEEKKIVLEADRAMLLLREEGSSVAFPEVVQQIRGDMRTVADRLAQTKIDGITQGIQEDILAALEEMIAALQKAQRDLEEQQKQEQMPPQQQGQPGEQPLVESLAELKLIRTMQERIKGTTDRYSEMIDQRNQPVDRDFLGLLQSLADRQSRLSTITRDIALERNR